MIPHNLRHFASLKFLETVDENDYVFFVDSRDLVFQKSPVEIAHMLRELGNLHVFDEGKFYFKGGSLQNFDESIVNSMWVRHLLNAKEIPSFLKGRDKYVLNGGCVIGKAKSFVEYFNRVCELILLSNSGIWEILDQATLNVTIYERLLSNPRNEITKIYPNGEVVLNMCGVIEEEVKTNDGKVLLRGKIIPIVHQFDRFGSYSVEKGFEFTHREYRIA